MTIANNQHKCLETHSDSTKIINKTRLSTLSTPVQYSTWSLSWSCKTTKEMKEREGKEEKDRGREKGKGGKGKKEVGKYLSSL